MSFLAPLFLAGGLAVVLPIVLHLLKREPEARVRFAAVRLLQHAPIEHADRRHLRELLLLALRVAGLLLLAFAFARPYLSGSTGVTGPVTVVVLDTSLSMSAPGQFGRAQQLARAAIGRIPSGDAVAVVTFADSAEVIASPSNDRATAMAAIDASTTSFGVGRYRAAIVAAGDLIAAQGGRGSIAIVTDLQASGWETGDRAPIPEGVVIEVLDVGAPPPNLAVTSVRRAGDRVVAVVLNGGADARDARVRLDIDGTKVADAVAGVGAGEAVEIPLALPANQGAVARPQSQDGAGVAAAVSVEDDSGAPGDNIRHAFLNESQRPPVLLVTTDGDAERSAFFLRHALTAEGAEGALYDVEAVSGAEMSRWEAQRLDRFAAIVLTSTRGLERKGRESLATYLTGGGGVLMAAGPQVDPQVAVEIPGPDVIQMEEDGRAPSVDTRAAGEGRRLAPVDSRHPVLAAIGADSASLGLVTFRRIARLDAPRCETLARFTTGEAALVECERKMGRLMVLASDLDRVWNDFPRHAAFVPFVHEVVRHLAQGRQEAGELLVADVPAGVPPRPGVVVRPPAPAGAQLARRRSGGRVVINVDPAESSPARLSVDEFEAPIARMQPPSHEAEPVQGERAENRQRVWQDLLALMAGAMIVESFVARRTG